MRLFIVTLAMSLFNSNVLITLAVSDEHKLADMLYDVDAPKVKRQADDLIKPNIVVFLTESPNCLESIRNFSRRFPVHGFVKPCDETIAKKKYPEELRKLMGDTGETCNCDFQLQASLASLISWARKSERMTTGILTTTNTSSVSEIRSPEIHGNDEFQSKKKQNWNRGGTGRGSRGKQQESDAPSGPDLFDLDTIFNPVESKENSYRAFIEEMTKSERSSNSEVPLPKSRQEPAYTPYEDFASHENYAKKIADMNAEGENIEMGIIIPANIEVIPEVAQADNMDQIDYQSTSPKRYKREVYYKSRPERQMLIKPTTSERSKYNQWNAFDLMRRSIIDDFMSSLGFGSDLTDEDEDINLDRLGKVQEPSLYHLIRTALIDVEAQSVRSKDGGYLLVLIGGTKDQSVDVTESVKYILDNTNKRDTLVVVSGTCPKCYSDEDNKRKKKNDKTMIPYYATGYKCRHLGQLEHLSCLPRKIKEVFSPPRNRKHVDMPARSVKYHNDGIEGNWLNQEYFGKGNNVPVKSTLFGDTRVKNSFYDHDRLRLNRGEQPTTEKNDQETTDNQDVEDADEEEDTEDVEEAQNTTITPDNKDANKTSETNKESVDIKKSHHNKAAKSGTIRQYYLTFALLCLNGCVLLCNISFCKYM